MIDKSRFEQSDHSKSKINSKIETNRAISNNFSEMKSDESSIFRSTSFEFEHFEIRSSKIKIRIIIATIVRLSNQDMKEISNSRNRISIVRSTKRIMRLSSRDRTWFARLFMRTWISRERILLERYSKIMINLFQLDRIMLDSKAW